MEDIFGFETTDGLVDFQSDLYITLTQDYQNHKKGERLKVWSRDFLTAFKFAQDRTYIQTEHINVPITHFDIYELVPDDDEV